MLHPVSGSSAADPADRTPSRERTLELVASVSTAV